MSIPSKMLTQPFRYWDWTLDSLDPASSTIWDPVSGFGGNGNPNVTDNDALSTRKCVTDGPFKDLRPSYVTDNYNEHCLARNWNNGTDFPGRMLGENYTPEVVAGIQAIGNYTSYRYDLEGTPHGAIHASIGGDMGPSTSPNGMLQPSLSPSSPLFPRPEVLEAHSLTMLLHQIRYSSYITPRLTACGLFGSKKIRQSGIQISVASEHKTNSMESHLRLRRWKTRYS